jgi:hypothetical protein
MDERLLAEQALAADPGLAGFFLGRLAALLIRQMTTEHPDDQPILGHALLSTFRDCMDLGLTEQAFDIMDYVHDALPLDDALAA